MPHPSKPARLLAVAVALFGLLALDAGCGQSADDGANPYPAGDGDASLPPTGWGGGSGIDCDAGAQPGCACNEEGAQLACGKVEDRIDGYVVCGQGFSVCSGGTWNPCIINNSITVPTPAPGSSKALALGPPSPCTSNPCTPSCIDFPDTPGGIPADAGTGIVIDDGGVGLPGTISPACVPKTCAGLGYDCGPAGDGCGKLLNCGTCSTGFLCGSVGKPNVCVNAKPCLPGSLCNQQVVCTGGATTSVSGIVYAPNGVDPIPNAVVYVNDGPVAAFPTTITCEQCTTPSGSPLVTTTTDVNGYFKLDNVPVGANIPLVIQVGRWRRQVTFTPSACTNTPLAASQTRLPKNKSEGDIPKMAFVTGGVDAMECVLRKIGVQDSEFTNPSGSGRIHLYAGSDYPGQGLVKYGPGGTEWEWVLLGNVNTLKKYDMVLFPCQGYTDYDWSSYYSQPSDLQALYNNIANYVNSGGRMFATHFSYRWLYRGYYFPSAVSPLSGALNWNIDADAWTGRTGYIDTGFPKGKLLADWLQGIGASGTYGQIWVDTVRKDFNSVVSPTQRWMAINSSSGTPIHASFNTPLGAAPANQCGRVVFSDFHVEDASTYGDAFPSGCPGGTMTPQEKLLEFMLFDLAACIQPDVPTSTCTPMTCAQQGLQCGPAGDGCGGTLNCGTCTAPETCGGGGLSGICGAPTVVKEGSFVRDYDMTGQCKQGETVRWGLWSWSSLLPSDSQIAFEVQTADTAAGLAAAPKQALQFSNPPGPAGFAGQPAVARNSPAPSTASGSADVGTTLKALGWAYNAPLLRVTSRLIPSSDKTKGPVLQSWNLQASCVPDQ